MSLLIRDASNAAKILIEGLRSFGLVRSLVEAARSKGREDIRFLVAAPCPFQRRETILRGIIRSAGFQDIVTTSTAPSWKFPDDSLYAIVFDRPLHPLDIEWATKSPLLVS